LLNTPIHSGDIGLPGKHELPLTGPEFIALLQTTLAEGIAFRFRARGCSMDPFIRDGDVIMVSPAGEGSPGMGNVVTFVQRGIERVLVHRVIRIRTNFYYMKGDSTGGGDLPVPRANILGLVTGVERGRKRVLIAFLTRKELMSPLVRVAMKLRGSIRKMRKALFVSFHGKDVS
jgi:signal peptidase I